MPAYTVKSQFFTMAHSKHSKTVLNSGRSESLKSREYWYLKGKVEKMAEPSQEKDQKGKTWEHTLENRRGELFKVRGTRQCQQSTNKTAAVRNPVGLGPTR